MTKAAVPHSSKDRYHPPKITQPHLRLVGAVENSKKRKTVDEPAVTHPVRPEIEADFDDMWDNVPV